MRVPADKMPHAIDDTWNDNENDIYAEDRLDTYTDDDVISPTEEGFMLGYLSA